MTLPSKKPKYNRLWDRIDKASLVVGLCFGALAVIGGFYTITELRKKPEIEWGWFEIDKNGKLSIMRGPLAIVDIESLKTNELSIPMQLAFRNVGTKTAKSVRIELSYPTSLKVKSSAPLSIRMEPDLITYRHEIGDLVPSRSFTPLKEYDIVFLKANVFVDAFIVLSKDGVPTYFMPLVTMPEMPKNGKKITISIFGENLAPVDMFATLNLPPIDLHIYWPPDARVDAVKAKDLDIKPVMAALQKSQQIDSWESKYDKKNTILYSKLKLDPKGTIQLLYVNKQLKRAILDLDNDDMIDYELFDTDQDGRFDRKIIYERLIPMIDWKLSPEDLKQ